MPIGPADIVATTLSAPTVTSSTAGLAPASGGGSTNFLCADGTWQPAGGGSPVTPAALTKTDDTNVTLTLGGTPTTALLQATSITAGWAGTLAVARGGTGAGTAAAAATALGVGTGNSPEFTAINVGHPSDTTITRTGSGDIAVEGNAIYRVGGTDASVADGGTGASTAAGAATNLGLGTGDSPQFTAVNVGAATDTTLARQGAAVLAVEGKMLYATGTVTLADGATPALDASLGSTFLLTAAGDRTIAIPSNPQAGQKIVIAHTASGGARTLALNPGTGGFRFGTDVTALTATSSGLTDYIGCIYNATANKFDVIAYSKGY